MENKRNTTLIREMPEEDRPMEKMIRLGAAALSNEELASILIGTGIRDKSALDLAYQLMRGSTMRGWLLNASVEELCAISGIGQTKACRLVAGVMLGRRLIEERDFFDIRLSQPETVANYFRSCYAQEDREHFCAILLDAKLHPLRNVLIAVGTRTDARIHPREVFLPAIRAGAIGMILAHNHPSGDPEPSAADLSMTERLESAGELLGIRVYDHIVVGSNGYVSIRDRRFQRSAIRDKITN